MAAWSKSVADLNISVICDSFFIPGLENKYVYVCQCVIVIVYVCKEQFEV